MDAQFRYRIILSLFWAALLWPFQIIAQEEVSPIHPVLPQAFEIELALSAAPAHLQEEATVYVLKRGGYEKVREGSNGFACLVRRSGVTQNIYYDSMAPMCFDPEGVRTLLPASLDQTKLIEEGKSLEEVYQLIEEGFKSGKYKAPSNGVVYMLSAATFVPDFAKPGYSVQYVPHYMFYGPGVNGADIGMEKANPFGVLPFVPVPDKPWTFIVVPMGKKERTEISKKHQHLVAEAKKHLKISE